MRGGSKQALSPVLKRAGIATQYAIARGDVRGAVCSAPRFVPRELAAVKRPRFGSRKVSTIRISQGRFGVCLVTASKRSLSGGAYMAKRFCRL